MYLEKITEGYFAYCQFCIYENHCQLRHNKFLGIVMPDLIGVCTGRILYDPNRKILVCEDCEIAIEKPLEKGVCHKFNAASIFSVGEPPSLRPGRRAVARVW